ncbi:hypothetical protein [Methylocystis sp. Sn-Cys]|uniref:CdiA C-terminal domain-containing protein n=1 Tax=Methylocystis sp. Sn-Cys TaxID=1701263 RepID=UPI00351C878E
MSSSSISAPTLKASSNLTIGSIAKSSTHSHRERIAARNVWSSARYKVTTDQSENVVINLMDSPLTIEEIIAQFRAFPIPGLRRLWLIDRYGKLYYLF